MDLMHPVPDYGGVARSGESQKKLQCFFSVWRTAFFVFRKKEPAKSSAIDKMSIAISIWILADNGSQVSTSLPCVFDSTFFKHPPCTCKSVNHEILMNFFCYCFDVPVHPSLNGIAMIEHIYRIFFGLCLQIQLDRSLRNHHWANRRKWHVIITRVGSNVRQNWIQPIPPIVYLFA